jgi:hypothetical protein
MTDDSHRPQEKREAKRFRHNAAEQKRQRQISGLFLKLKHAIEVFLFFLQLN